jgi:hypothetical protein
LRALLNELVALTGAAAEDVFADLPAAEIESARDVSTRMG